MGFPTVHEVIERSSGALGEDLHCAVVDHEEVMPWLRERGQQRPERPLGRGRRSWRQVYAKVNHRESRRALYRAVFSILTADGFGGCCRSCLTSSVSCSWVISTTRGFFFM